MVDDQLQSALNDSVRLATTSCLSNIWGDEPVYKGLVQDKKPFDGIIGILSYIGDAAWSMSLGLERAMAITIAQKFTGMDIDYNSSDMADFVGELVNIVAGDVVARLDNVGITAEMSLPTVAQGCKMELLAPEKAPLSLMRFVCPDGEFWVQLATDKRHRKIKAEKQFKQAPAKTDERYNMGNSENNMFPASQVNCVKQAVTSTFASICEEEPGWNENGEDNTAFNGIIGVISIVGADKPLSLMLGFPHEAATAIAEKFAGFEIDYDSDDMGDVIGELANIVAGDAVARLDTIGIEAEMSVPTITRGSDMELLISGSVATKHINFEIPSGKFWLKLATGKQN